MDIAEYKLKCVAFSIKNMQIQHKWHSNVNHRRVIIFIFMCSISFFKNQPITTDVLETETAIYVG